MKFPFKKQLTPSQRDTLKREVVKEYEKVQEEHEKKVCDILLLFVQIALCTTLQDELGFGVETRIPRFRKAFINNMNKFFNELCDNKAEYTENGRTFVNFDIEGNRGAIEKACQYFGIHYDESIFDDEVIGNG